MASVSGTYSFLDVLASFAGPGASGGFDIQGMGIAAEGIKVTMNGDQDIMSIGAAGDGMHSLSASKAGRISITLLKTGPGNALLNALFNYQRQSSAYWGQNQMSVRNPVTGDSVVAQAGAFVKRPDVIYDVAGPMMVWEFNFVEIDTTLGNSYQNIAVIV